MFNPARGRLATTCALSARGAQAACRASCAAAPLFKRNFTANRAAFLVPAAGSRQAVVRVGFASPRTRQGWRSQPSLSGGAAAPVFLQTGLLRVRRALLRLLAAVGGWRCRAAGRRASGRRRVRFARLNCASFVFRLFPLPLRGSCCRTRAHTRGCGPACPSASSCALRAHEGRTPAHAVPAPLHRRPVRARAADRLPAGGIPRARRFAKPALLPASRLISGGARRAGGFARSGSRREATTDGADKSPPTCACADGPRPTHPPKRAA